MKPCIILVGLDQVFLDEIVQGLTGGSTDPANSLIDWTIDTKYYTADVHLSKVNSKMLVEESVANAAEILILLIDPSQVHDRSSTDRPLTPVRLDLDKQSNQTRQLAALSKRSQRLRHETTRRSYTRRARQ